MEIEIIQETCCNDECGVNFWISKELKKRLVSSKRTFYCPNGHGMNYQGESDDAKIRRLQFEKERILREKNIEIEQIKKECKNKKHKKVKSKKT